MIKGKESYLKKLTATTKIPSTELDKELEGSTPPSVFVGSWNYPKVLAGPMLAPLHGDTRIMDMPESWLPEKKTQEEIIEYRLNLIRGKQAVNITDLKEPLVEKLQEIALANGSIESEALFSKNPRGISFSDIHGPLGPSASIVKLDIEGAKWDRALEKVYYDGDLIASDAVMDLHRNQVPFSSIQKAFSVGAMGIDRRRRLVPTRWSITACDSTIGKRLQREVRDFDLIEACRVHEFFGLQNYYSVLLMPTPWQYEWMEAFLHILGREELIFSDHEHSLGKRTYSTVGGCYYTCKMAVLEALFREKKQAGAIIFREAYKGYVPLGVFNVRENVRNAMTEKPAEFEDMKTALKYISTKLSLPVKRFIGESTLLKELLKGSQTTLSYFT